MSIKVFEDKYEYLSHTWGYTPKEKTVTFKNNRTDRVYTQPLYEHLKGSLCRQERLDDTFDEFKEKAYKIYNNLYEYSDFISYAYPITVTNTVTKESFNQRIQHILKGSLPSDEKRRKYTKNNCQYFNDLAHNCRFIIDTNTFEDANSIVTVTDKTTGKEYKQYYCVHIKGCLPKEISYSNISRKEKFLIDLLEDQFKDIPIITGYRPKWLKGKEIDIYLPTFNIGIEYNRSYLSSF